MSFLTVDASKRTLVSPGLLGLTEQINELASDADVRLIEVAANGTVFCAGMDLGEMQDRAAQSGPEDWLKDSEVYRDLLLAILQAPRPVLAIVQGPVLAGGVGIVLACDLVIASQQAFFALPEPQRGITAAMVTPLLVRRVGVGHANHLLLAGDRVSTAELANWGICQKVVEADELDAVAMQFRASVLAGSPQALAATKRQVQHFAADIVSQLNQAAEMSANARATEDAQEGLAAFLEKRKPSWQIDSNGS